MRFELTKAGAKTLIEILKASDHELASRLIEVFDVFSDPLVGEEFYFEKDWWLIYLVEDGLAWAEPHQVVADEIMTIPRAKAVEYINASPKDDWPL